MYLPTCLRAARRSLEFAFHKYSFMVSAMYMDGRLILRKARGLLYQFRQLVRIPCTLAGMCQRCGPGIWDSTHRPSVECTGAHDFCKYAVQ